VGVGADLNHLEFTEHPASLQTQNPNQTLFSADVATAPSGPTAVYGEIDYEQEGIPYSLTTGIFIGKLKR
jgi:hypothetical protein